MSKLEVVAVCPRVRPEQAATLCRSVTLEDVKHALFPLGKATRPDGFIMGFYQFH